MRFIASLALSLGAVVSATLAAQSGTGRSAAPPPQGRYVAIGCVARQGTVAAPRYVITDSRGDKPAVYRLQGDTALLAQHVGHTVEVRGSLTPSTIPGQYTLRVNALTYVARTCGGK